MKLTKLVNSAILATLLLGGSAQAADLKWEVSAKHDSPASDNFPCGNDIVPDFENGVTKTYLASLLTTSGNGYMEYDDQLVMYICWANDGEHAWVKNLYTGCDSWVQAIVDGDDLYVPTGQPVFYDVYGREYALMTGVLDLAANNLDTLSGIHFTCSPDRSLVTMEENTDEGLYKVFLTVRLEDGAAAQAFSAIRMEVFEAEPVSVPEGAEYKRFDYNCMLGGYAQWQNRSWIAFDGNDAYVQGLEWVTPEGWVKGTVLSDGSIRVPSGQFICLNGNYPDYYLAANLGTNAFGEPMATGESESFLLEYNPEERTYTMADGDCFKCGKDLSWGYLVSGSQYRQIDLNEGTPKAPEFLEYDRHTKTLTVEASPLNTEGQELDYSMLSLRLYVDDEPYIFTPANSPYDYETDRLGWGYNGYVFDGEYDVLWGTTELDGFFQIRMELPEDAGRLSVEVVHTLWNSEWVSERAHLQVSGVDEVVTEGTPVQYYSIDGRLLSAPQRGINILRYSDGTVRKVLIQQ